MPDPGSFAKSLKRPMSDHGASLLPCSGAAASDPSRPGVGNGARSVLVGNRTVGAATMRTGKRARIWLKTRHLSGRLPSRSGGHR